MRYREAQTITAHQQARSSWVVTIWKKRRDLVLCGIVLLFATVIRLPQQTSIYTWDEVDYVQAARLGFRVNYLSTTALDAESFVQKGLIKWLHLGDQLIVTPPGYDPTRDSLVLAHYHPPLVIYVVAAARALFGEAEWSVRLPSLLFNLMTILLLYVGALVTFGELGRAIGLWSAVALAAMPVQVHSSRILSMHPASTFFAMAGLFSFLLFRRTGHLRYLYGIAVAAGLSFLSLDFFPSIIGLAVLVCVGGRLVSFREGEVRVSPHLLGVGLLFLGLVIVGWPGGVLRFGWVQMILLRAYNLQVLVGGERSWFTEFAQAYLFWTLLYVGSLCLCATFCFRARSWWIWGPVMLFIGIILLGVLSIPFRIFTHGLPLFTVISLVVGFAVAQLLRLGVVGRLLGVGAVVLMVGSGVIQLTQVWNQGDGKKILHYLQEMIPAGTPILADGAHIYRYYFPERPFVDLAFFEDTKNLRTPEQYTPETSQRLRQYLDLRREVLAGQYAYLILQARRPLWDPELRTFVESRYRLIQEVSDSAELYRLVQSAG